jgi:predicted RNase H-like nuclease
MFELFVGVDVAKDSSTARGLNSTGTSLFSIEFDMNIEGFSNLLKAITDNRGDASSVLVAMRLPHVITSIYFRSFHPKGSLLSLLIHF